ncbi:redoxin domain-containing protein [Paenibacillus tengchongensis]|uniref:redoxin domain-containing protein n=1 Tax=Paenibacillus tengchongensis TaxID=2608684 RepID=UPI00124E3B73|nr:redoxin domain-containing protein [Paenibacillus tengchongensis]
MSTAHKPIQVIILVLLLMLGGYAIASSAFGGGGGTAREGAKAPDLRLSGLDGKPHSLEEYKNQVVVLNFWGSWCAPCVKEMPVLQAGWEKYREHGVVVVGVNVGEDQVTVGDFVKQVGIDFPVLLDQGRNAAGSYGVSPLPTTFFINKKGKVENIHIGQLDRIMLDAQIRELLGD